MTTKPSALCAAAPVFVVQDVLKSVAHYRDAGVERDGVTIHLPAARMTKRQPGHGAVYGMRDFEVNDLDGNQLSFGTESKK